MTCRWFDSQKNLNENPTWRSVEGPEHYTWSTKKIQNIISKCFTLWNCFLSTYKLNIPQAHFEWFCWCILHFWDFRRLVCSWISWTLHLVRFLFHGLVQKWVAVKRNISTSAFTPISGLECDLIVPNILMSIYLKKKFIHFRLQSKDRCN